jgi:uncharacterized protein (TIGR00299 family) protein
MSKNILYFDAFSGISGDMCLGALLDLFEEKAWFEDELAKLNLEGYQIKQYEKNVKGIKSLKVDVITEEQKAHRHLKHINEMIDNSSLETKIKEDAKAIFLNLAQAEAKVHGTTVEKVHFHEVGAIDAVIDIVGTAILINKLSPDAIYASALPTGKGFIDCDHGKMPLPAPATAELLKGIPVYDPGITGELVTPTGAAIIKTLASSFGNMPELEIEKIGYGSGTIERETPNLLRVFYGKEDKKKLKTAV